MQDRNSSATPPESPRSSTSPNSHQHLPTTPTTPRRTAPKLHLPPSCDPPSVENPPKQAVWIVFGATGHIGRSLTQRILASTPPSSAPYPAVAPSEADCVTAVGRLPTSPPLSASSSHSKPEAPIHHTFPASPTCLPLSCDVRHPPTIQHVVTQTLQRFGKIDVIANCTGYGVIGACEDQSEAEIRSQWEVNFLGTLNIINATLPYFRQRGGGRYAIFSSTSGALGVPGLGPYCATKYAVEALVESMLYEIDAFSVKATLVAPGFVRRPPHTIPPSTAAPHSTDPVVFKKHNQPTTDPTSTSPSVSSLFHPSTMTTATTATTTTAIHQAIDPLPTYGHFLIKPPSQAYASATAPAGHMKRAMNYIGANQPVSAWKVAEVVWQLGHCKFPPLRLLLGAWAVEMVRERGRCVIEEIEDWKHLSFPMTANEAAEAEAEADADPEPDLDTELECELEREAELDQESEMAVDGNDDRRAGCH